MQRYINLARSKARKTSKKKGSADSDALAGQMLVSVELVLPAAMHQFVFNTFIFGASNFPIDLSYN